MGKMSSLRYVPEYMLSSIFPLILCGVSFFAAPHAVRHAASHAAIHRPLPVRGVCGELPRSATWRAPIIRLRGSLHIPKDMELWLAPGTRLEISPVDSCHPGRHPTEIVVDGRLVVEGNAWQPVTLAPESGFWAGVRVQGSVRIDYARVSGADRGIWFHGGSGEVRSSLFSDCVLGIRANGGATPKLSHLLFTRNMAAGLRVEAASPMVEGCLFYGNRGTGAWFMGTGLTRMSRNAFWNNLLGDVQGTAQWGLFRKGKKDGLLRDGSGNLRCDPVFAGSMRDLAWKDSLRMASRRPPDPPFGFAPYALSTLSPLRGQGPRLPSKFWKRSDIGLYGLDCD